ncbi:DUF2922 domain-containing protein [Azotosporobacter soli]|uniref:DUF2922 domain-containing protein n=1 Tax=Azotosporobacter soli TaxID=3055040 RepID=UPI0031FEF40C
MAKVLEMVFRNESGKEIVVSLAEPKDDLNLTQVRTVMEMAVAKNILRSSGGALNQVVEARINSREAVVLA